MSNADRIHDIIQESTWIHGTVPIPTIVELSPTDQCNLRCSICPHASPSYPNNKVYMSEMLAHQLVYDLHEIRFGGLVVLSGYGEPLCHPRISEIVRILAQDQRVDVVTNGVLLTERMLSKLLLSGVNKILVSAYSPEVGARMSKLFRDVSVEKYEIRPRYKLDFLITNRGGALTHHGNRNPCWYLNYCMMVDYNGDVMLCPQDFLRNVRFGNLMTEKLMDIWDGPEMNRYRQTLMTCRRGLEPCTHCDVEGTVHGEEQIRLWKRT